MLFFTKFACIIFIINLELFKGGIYHLYFFYYSALARTLLLISCKQPNNLPKK
jgi:hypothetical protein